MLDDVAERPPRLGSGERGKLAVADDYPRINLLDEDFIRRDVVWFTTKNAKGATSIKRLSASGLHKTMSGYNAYRQGKLVELPFLGSIFLSKSMLME